MFVITYKLHISNLHHHHHHGPAVATGFLVFSPSASTWQHPRVLSAIVIIIIIIIIFTIFIIFNIFIIIIFAIFIITIIRNLIINIICIKTLLQ